jgi:citronellol/citronellal dehydrogenase
MKELAGKVAVITGSTRGIGRAAAVAFGESGASVVVVGRSSRSSNARKLVGTVEDVAEELASRGIEALPVQADLTDPDQAQAIVDRTLEWKGTCDTLVNNAAYTSNGPVLSVPWRRWQTAFRVQVVAPLQLCQGFLPGMLERGEGRIVNVSSGASQSMTPDLGLYSTSKLAMERWSEYMHMELAGTGVAVNTLRVDRIVVTEGFQYVLETQGEEVATGGQGLAATMSPQDAADHLVWMVTRPASWTGNIVGFADISALGGPARALSA